MWVWIGGGCAQPVVVKEAQKEMADVQTRLIRISPSSSAEEGIVDYAMTCHGGGTLDISIEPVLLEPHVLILGRSPVAVALAKLAKVSNYNVSAAASGAGRESFPDAESLKPDLDLSELNITPHTFIVVSTHGESDEEALEKAAQTNADYVVFVASKKKAGEVLDYLRVRGINAARLTSCGLRRGST